MLKAITETPNPNFSHLLLLGRAGSGKLSRARTFIHLLSKSKKKLKVRPETLKLELKEKKSSTVKGKEVQAEDVPILLSRYHMEINASSWTFLKQEQVFTSLLSQFHNSFQIKNINTFFCSKKEKPIQLPKILIVLHAETLTAQTQKTMFHIIEENINFLKIIFLTSDKYVISGPLQSRCFLVVLPSPTILEMVVVLKEEAEYRLNVFEHPDDEKLREKIALDCEHNLHLAIQIYKKSILENKLTELNPTHAENLTSSDMKIKIFRPFWYQETKKIANILFDSSFQNQNLIYICRNFIVY